MAVDTSPRVRLAVEPETDAIATLIRRAMAEYSAADPAVHEGYLAYSLDPLHADGDQLVAELQGQIVGAVLFHARATAQPSWPPTAATFQTLVVDPSMRGRGIGGLLVGACIDRARASGATSIVIETLPWLTAADRIYGRFGFERWSEGDWDGTSMLRRLLGGRDAPTTMLSAWRLDFTPAPSR